MKTKSFLDTNILVCAQDAGAGAKQRQSRELIVHLAQSGQGVISTQVMQEFFAASTRKLGVAPLAAKAILTTFSAFEIVPVSPALIYEAIDCVVLYKISFCDGLLLATAASAGCSTLYTEGFQPGQALRGVTIRNPLVPALPS